MVAFGAPQTNEAAAAAAASTGVGGAAPAAPPSADGSGKCDPSDHSVHDAGTDGISSVCWSPTSDHIIGTNWDGGVRCWEVQESGGQVRALPKAQSESFPPFSLFSLALSPPPRFSLTTPPLSLSLSLCLILSENK